MARDTQGNVILDVSNLGGGIQRPTTTFFFKGPQTSGTIISLTIPGDGWIVGLATTSACVLTRGRTFASIGASTWSRSIAVSNIPGQSYVQLRERCARNDTISVDSSGGLGTSDTIAIFYEFDV